VYSALVCLNAPESKQVQSTKLVLLQAPDLPRAAADSSQAHDGAATRPADNEYAESIDTLKEGLCKRQAEVEYLQGALEAAVTAQHSTAPIQCPQPHSGAAVPHVTAELRELKGAAVRYDLQGAVVQA
jgi:hypothetical protein